MAHSDTSAAGRAIDVIRARIIAGEIHPGERLTEEQLRADLGISRSTLREALRSLVQQRLVVHHLARGFFVRSLTSTDLIDLYLVRRMVECGAVRQISQLTVPQLQHLASAVDRGTRAVTERSWQDAASASIGFHEAIVNLAGSPRLSEINQRTLAEFRLSYAVMANPFDFHVPFIARHAELAHLIQQGRTERAADMLHQYLMDSEQAVLALFRS